MPSIMLSMLLTHFATFFLQVFMPLFDIILVLASAAAVPTARPIPMLFAAVIFLDDVNKFIPPITKVINILTFGEDKTNVKFFREVLLCLH